MQNSFPRMHVSLYVRNIQNTIGFYSAFFGQQPNKVKTDYAKFMLESPSLIISFIENPEKVAPGFGHLGFQIENVSELENRLEKAKSQGLPILEEMNVSCCYAEQDKFWVTDPDGYHWEVYLFKNDASFNDPRYTASATGEAACCTPVSKAEPELTETLTAVCCTPGQCC